MVQKEVADKVKSDAEKKSFLWRLLNYQYDVRYHKTVPAKAFSPAPKVQSAVFSLVAKASVPTFSYTLMVALLERISMYKRKTLGKIWKMAGEQGEDGVWSIMVVPEGESAAIRIVLPEDLAGKRLEEIGREEMGRVLS
jgi:16S rRNA A1518/A1519 N6-dimethyltransferase RsmA/KsgA/DIM1 with predicted DNA glycosylase/AP lyase activity